MIFFCIRSFNGRGGAEFIYMSEFASHMNVHILPGVSLYLFSLEALHVSLCLYVCLSVRLYLFSLEALHVCLCSRLHVG